MFANSFITTVERHVRELETKHPMFTCAFKRQDFCKREHELCPDAVSPKPVAENKLVLPDPDGFRKSDSTKANITVELNDCFECNKLDEHVQLLRLSRLRLDLYEHCYEYSPKQTLLLTMAWTYAQLRNVSNYDIDIYLFLQTTHALTRLHDRHCILLSKHTKSRYFSIWLMYFAQSHTDHLFSVECWRRILLMPSDDILRDMWTLSLSLTFVRRFVVAPQSLCLELDPDHWTSFVDRINRLPEVVKLRHSYNYTPFLFNLNPHEFLDKEDRTGILSPPMEHVQNIVQT